MVVSLQFQFFLLAGCPSGWGLPGGGNWEYEPRGSRIGDRRWYTFGPWLRIEVGNVRSWVEVDLVGEMNFVVAMLQSREFGASLAR